MVHADTWPFCTMHVLHPSCQLTQPSGMVGVDAGAGGSGGVGAWHVNSQHESVRMAHWPIGQLGGWHIMRHSCGRESSQNEACASSATAGGAVGLSTTVGVAE